MTWTQQQIDETLRAIVERSMSDSTFRSLALRDATAAINQVASAPLPAGFRVRFVDNAGADMTVVLPDPVPVYAGEIRDEELAGVAGGVVGGGGGDGGGGGGPVATRNNLTACNPSFTRKPGSPAFCPG